MCEMYYLTVTRDDKDVLRRHPFADYSEAVAGASQFYKPKAGRSTLTFSTEVINGLFARSYATLERPEALDENKPFFEARYHHAVKHDNAFSFDASYFFLIESDFGVSDAEAMREEGDEHED